MAEAEGSERNPFEEDFLQKIVNVGWAHKLDGFVICGVGRGAPPTSPGGDVLPATTTGDAGRAYNKDNILVARLQGKGGGNLRGWSGGSYFSQNQALCATQDKDKNSFLGYDMAASDDNVAGVMVAKYSPIGGFLWGWTFKNSGGQDANALACDDKGNVYVSWLEASVTSHLTKLTPTGEIIWDKTFGTSHGGFVDPSIFQVCCDKAGNVFASIFSSTGPSLVKAFKPNGDNLWTANFNGVTGNHRIPGKFIAGYSYAVPSVLKINSGTGEIAWSMGVDAFFLEGVDIAFDGSIYAILNSDPGYSVRCYNPDGSVRYTVLVASGNSSIPFSDNIVASGKFWMVPFGTHFVNEELGDYDVYSVKVFNQSDGSLVTTIPWGTSYPSSQNLGVDIIWSLGRP